jgi:hypothetical protein
MNLPTTTLASQPTAPLRPAPRLPAASLFVAALLASAALSACSGDDEVSGPAAADAVAGGDGLGDVGGIDAAGDTGADSAADTDATADAATDEDADASGPDASDAGDAADSDDVSDAADGEDGETSGGDGDTGGACPGGEGCDCDSNNACDGGACLDTPEGKKCAVKCTTSCAPGFSCQDIGDDKPLFFCVSTQVALCAPCKFNSDCQVNGVASLCLDYGPEGKFCGAPCADAADCPSGYACAEEQDGSGNAVKQCLRQVDAAGVCPCSAWATAKGMETECAVTNSFGTCKASRTCGAAGLSACNAKAPASEVCNSLDDDCDGTTDNLPETLTCTLKAFLGEGSAVDCKADGDCKVEGEACDPDKGKCYQLLGACPGKPTCGADGKLTCTGAATPSPEACNGTDDDCDGATDEATCDDGDACTADTCDGTGKACSSAPAKDCDDGDPCTTDSCDKATGDCKHEANTGSCDDGDACTEGDLCAIDLAGKASCQPGAKAKDCDDSNPCTDDACDKATGCTHTPNSGEVECYTGPKDTAGKGICVKGKQICKDGQIQATCVDEVKPAAAEDCDGKDNTCDGVTDEGCKPTDVNVTFAAARVQGKAGQSDLDLIVGLGGPSGKVAASAGGKTSADFGFLAWLQALLKK